MYLLAMHCPKKDTDVTTTTPPPPPPTRRMFITMDVVFHEDLMYFSSNSELQGDHHEIQTLDYDYHISMKGESGLLNWEVSKLYISGATSKPSSINSPKAEEVI